MTNTIVIIAVIMFVLVVGIVVFYLLKKHRNSFRIVINDGLIKTTRGNIPAEFLFDVQQLARMEKPPKLIVIATNLVTEPELSFQGEISLQLQHKLNHALKLSLQ